MLFVGAALAWTIWRLTEATFLLVTSADHSITAHFLPTSRRRNIRGKFLGHAITKSAMWEVGKCTMLVCTVCV